jgi:hypothetical protein
VIRPECRIKSREKRGAAGKNAEFFGKNTGKISDLEYL